MENTNKMEVAQTAHLETVTTNALMDIRAKYRKGQAEHGGEIWRKGLATLIGPEIRAEAIDLVVYTECLNVGLNEIRRLAIDLTHVDAPAGAQQIGKRILAILDGDLVDKA